MAQNVSKEAVSVVPNLFTEAFFYMVHALDLMVPASKNLTVWAKSYGGPYRRPFGPSFRPPFGLFPQGQIFGCRVIPYWNFTP